MRVDVRKTYKLFIGGAFPRSESGRTYVVTDAKGNFAANVAQGSRKDARDAVVAAHAAQTAWAGATAYNRGQVLYRVAEMMEGRRAQFEAAVTACEGLSAAKAAGVVSAAIDPGSGTPGGRTRSPRSPGTPTPSPGPTSTS